MENSKTNSDSRYNRNPRREEAQRVRKRRDRISIVVSGVAVPAVIFGVGALNSDHVEQSPQPHQDTSVTNEQQPDSLTTVDGVELDSIRTVTFDQQADGNYTLTETDDSGRDSEKS